MPPKGHLLTCGPGRHPDGKERDHEGGEIYNGKLKIWPSQRSRKCQNVTGEQVRCVSGDGEGVGEDTTHNLPQHEDQAEHTGHHQLPPGPESEDYVNPES